MIQFICYPKCTTCQKAKKWLDDNKIEYEFRDIKLNNPTLDELTEWYKKSGLPLKKFFNTSGLLYKSLDLKNELPTMSENEMLRLLASDGMQVCYTGIPNLKLGVALISPDDDRDTTIKKGLFRGIAAAAKYSAALFDVGAVWKGNFGAEKGYKAEDCDKAYQDHTLYAGFTFKGFANAKVGTKLNAAVGSYTGKESKIAGTKNVQSFLVAVGADFDFRNGISDTLSVGVGYSKDGELQTKVLPFVIRNTFRYSISKDAGFAMELCYAQAGLKEKTSVAANKNVPDGNAITPTNYKNEYGWMIVLKPGFSFVMGANTFSMGLKALVSGDIEPHGKQGHEMSWTGLRGRQASIDFPFSWEYKF